MEAGEKRLAGDTARAANTDGVKELRLLKKHARGWGRSRMRYPASEKLEIIRLVEDSHPSARFRLAKLGIPRTRFYR